MFRVAVLLPLLAATLEVTPQEYAAWFASSKGLQMSASSASNLAQKEATALSECGVTIGNLQALRDAMFDSGSDGLGLHILDVQKDILILAKQHVDAQKLNGLYQVLIGGWWRLPGGLTLPVSAAQPRALEMARAFADPQNLKDVYAVLFGYAGGILLPQTQAQQWAIEVATAGGDAATFQSQYALQTKKGATQDAALKAAEAASVSVYLHSLVRRYAKNAQLYTTADFQQYYADNWLEEWTAAPLEKRVHRDGKAYYAIEYEQYFGADWYKTWANDKEATQLRIADDGKKYTMPQFQQYYGNSWQTQWANAGEVACQECSAPSLPELTAVMV